MQNDVKLINNTEKMKYTFLIQNNVTKQTYSWILEDLTPNSIYHKFDIQLEEGTENAEYEYILFENPNSLEIAINTNDIFDSYLIGGETVIETFGILRIGDFGCPKQYNKNQSYIVYGK